MESDFDTRIFWTLTWLLRFLAPLMMLFCLVVGYAQYRDGSYIVLAFEAVCFFINAWVAHSAWFSPAWKLIPWEDGK